MSRRKSSLRDIDPVEVLYRAMRISEAVATKEQQRGEAANLKVLNEAMLQAASLAKDIAAIQDRRGTAPVEAPPKIDIEVVEGVVGLFTCQYCQRENRIEHYHAPPTPDLPRTIDAEAVKQSPVSHDTPAPAPSKPKPAPVKQFEPYNEKFHAGGPVKQATVNGSFDQYLGITRGNAITDFGFASDHKPRSDGGVT